MSKSNRKENIVDEALSLLREKNLLDRHSLFLTILNTGADISTEISNKCISIENIDDFFTRMNEFRQVMT